jgi:hypothetical protein
VKERRRSFFSVSLLRVGIINLFKEENTFRFSFSLSEFFRIRNDTRLVNNNSTHHKGVPLLCPKEKKDEYEISLTLIRITHLAGL